MKSLPLYLGGLLIAAAVAGAAVSLLTPPPPLAAPTAQAQAPPPRRAIEAKPEKEELSPQEVRARDEVDIMEILLAQIESTPSAIDEAWIAEMCLEISDVDSVAVFWKRVVASGQSYGVRYTSRNRKTGMVMSRNPHYYVFEAREHIYSTDPKEKDLLGPARGLLDMAHAKSWEASREEIRERLSKEQRKKVEDVVVARADGQPRRRTEDHLLQRVPQTLLGAR